MADPESSLTSLLTTTLEERGILGKVRAELRANVFLAIHEQHGLAGPKGPPAALTSLQADSAGRLATHLVLELMQACGLDYSLSVFGPEANVKGMLAERGQLAEALGLKGGVKADEPHEKDERTDHEALPVTKGEKFGANFWIHQYDFKGTHAKGCTAG